MVSTGGSIGEGFAIALDDTAERFGLLEQVAHPQTLRDVLIEAQAEMAKVAAAVAQAARDVANLWCDSLATENTPFSERLVDVSRALHRARLMLEQDVVILPGPEDVG